MRILHLLSHDRFRSGGAIQAYLLARAQRRLGHEVRFVSHDGGNPEEALEAFSPLLDEGFEVDPLPMRRWRRRLGLHRLRRLVERLEPDVIHAHRERAVRFAYDALARRPEPALVAQKGNCYRLDARTAAIFRSSRIDRIVAVAKAVKGLLVLRENVPPEKIEVVYGAFDRERFERAPRREEARRRLGLPLDRPLVGILANLDRKKRHDLFFEAAARARQRRPDLAFVVAGGRDEERALRLAAEAGLDRRDVFVLGYRRDAEAVIAALDVSVNCSSRGEGLTGALRESLALGVPVVATNVAGNGELVETGVTGLLVPTDDPEALSEAFVWCVEHPDEARAMAERGRRLVNALMDEDARARRVLEIYEEVLAWRRPSLARVGVRGLLHPAAPLFPASGRGAAPQERSERPAETPPSPPGAG